MNNFDLNALLAMSHSPLQNYIVPGLESLLIAGQSEKGCVRLFVNSRHQHHHITPHSHRFDFQCLVLRGKVWNTTFSSIDSGQIPSDADPYTVSQLVYRGQPGQYDKVEVGAKHFTFATKRYDEGEWYGMTHDEIHSICFSRDAVVLFFEGQQRTTSTKIIEPNVHGETVPTFEVAPWMFRDQLDVFA